MADPESHSSKHLHARQRLSARPRWHLLASRDVSVWATVQLKRGALNPRRPSRARSSPDLRGSRPACGGQTGCHCFLACYLRVEKPDTRLGREAFLRATTRMLYLVATLLSLAAASVAAQRQFEIINNCAETLWPARKLQQTTSGRLRGERGLTSVSARPQLRIKGPST